MRKINISNIEKEFIEQFGDGGLLIDEQIAMFIREAIEDCLDESKLIENVATDVKIYEGYHKAKKRQRDKIDKIKI